MKLTFWVLFVLVMLRMMSTGSQLKQAELSEQNYTVNWTDFDNLEWHSSNRQEVLGELNETRSPIGLMQEVGIVEKVVSSFVDFAGYSVMEIAKWCVHYGFENPRPYLAYVYLVMVLCFIEPIVVTLAVAILFVVWIYCVLKRLLPQVLSKNRRKL